MQEVNKKMAAGASWMILLRLAVRGLGFINTMILVRLLIPADFGIVAMAMSVIAILEIFGAFNFDVALIQKQDAERKHFDTAWTFNLLFGFCAAVSLVVLASPVAQFYNEARLQPVLVALGFAPLIRGLENIGVVTFRKELTFRKEFLYRGLEKLSAICVTIPLAFYWRNYWALVAGILLSQAIGVGLSYVMQPYRPRPSLKAWGELFHFSKWLFLNNLSTVLRFRLSDFIIGKLGGVTGLGFYTVGYEISNLPTTELVAPINRAVFPGYSRLSYDLCALRQGYLNVVAMIALISMPAGIGIAATADLFVPVLLGAKWTTIIPLIEILAIYGVLTAMQTNTFSVYWALGKPEIAPIFSFVFLAIFVPLLIVLTKAYWLMGAAWSMVITSAILLPINYAFVFRLLQLRLQVFFAHVWRPLVGSLSMYVVVRAFIQVVDGTRASSMFGMIGLFLMAVLIGAVMYTVTVLILWRLAGSPDGSEYIVSSKLLDCLRLKLPRWPSPTGKKKVHSLSKSEYENV
jgi:O-antigen/teichoic acid export membrane protein